LPAGAAGGDVDGIVRVAARPVLLEAAQPARGRRPQPGGVRLGPGPPRRVADRPPPAVRPGVEDHPGTRGGQAMTTLQTQRRDARFTSEGGGWLVFRERQPALAGRSAAELLCLARTLPGNLRYVPGADGEVLLCGEVRSLLDGAEAQQRLLRWLGPQSSAFPL